MGVVWNDGLCYQHCWTSSDRVTKQLALWQLHARQQTSILAPFYQFMYSFIYSFTLLNVILIELWAHFRRILRFSYRIRVCLKLRSRLLVSRHSSRDLRNSSLSWRTLDWLSNLERLSLVTPLNASGDAFPMSPTANKCQPWSRDAGDPSCVSSWGVKITSW
jgi:hypothetical protein